MVYYTQLEKLKARKPHRCTSCGEAIAIGEAYYRWRSYECGDAGTHKMHPECYEMHDADAVGGEWEYSPYSHERPEVTHSVQGEALPISKGQTKL